MIACVYVCLKNVLVGKKSKEAGRLWGHYAKRAWRYLGTPRLDNIFSVSGFKETIKF